MQQSGPPVIPVDVQPSLAHAAVQHLALAHGVDVLHIKGPALDPSLTAGGRLGLDADVLVRPSDAERLIEAMTSHGWTILSTFRTGSPFGHATTLHHPLWGCADIHRLFPGIGLDPSLAFQRLWGERHDIDIAGVRCAVPSVAAQSTILVLNAVRASGHSTQDLERVWYGAAPDQRTAILSLVRDLKADVAFAAATGELGRYRNRRDFDLWRVTSEGGTRLEEWRARMKAQPTLGQAVQVALQAVLVNPDHLRYRLGRPPTSWDIVREFFARPTRGIAEQLHRLRRKRRL